jgi:hypothetical protein
MRKEERNIDESQAMTIEIKFLPWTFHPQEHHAMSSESKLHLVEILMKKIVPVWGRNERMSWRGDKRRHQRNNLSLLPKKINKFCNWILFHSKTLQFHVSFLLRLSAITFFKFFYRVALHGRQGVFKMPSLRQDVRKCDLKLPRCCLDYCPIYRQFTVLCHSGSVVIVAT